MSHYHFKQGKKAETRFMELSGATSGVVTLEDVKAILELLRELGVSV